MDSAMGSIPIARSTNPVDAVGFTGFPPGNYPVKRPMLDAVGEPLIWHDLFLTYSREK
jgi:hypothetical protein